VDEVEAGLKRSFADATLWLERGAALWFTAARR
jgi:hypothetical protein